MNTKLNSGVPCGLQNVKTEKQTSFWIDQNTITFNCWSLVLVICHSVTLKLSVRVYVWYLCGGGGGSGGGGSGDWGGA